MIEFFTQKRTLQRPVMWAAVAAACMVVAACVSTPMPQQAPPAPVATQPQPAPAPPVATAPPVLAAPTVVSSASTAREFRRDAAGQIYKLNSNRIYKGKMQPLLYAIGVFEVEIDNRGQVVKTSWLRAPSHAPEVMAEIDRIARQAAPYPAPVRMGRVVYTDTWLWDKSGQFQLDTLTEGQY
jgi:periplasmic protein TonB